MIDALFWYTGLIVWVLIVLGIASMSQWKLMTGLL